MGRNEALEKQKGEPKKGMCDNAKSALPCKGRFAERFKDNPDSASAILFERARNGTEEERKTAKEALRENLKSSNDYGTTLQEMIFAGDGDPIMRKILSQDLAQRSQEEIGKLAGVESESVRVEIVKALADTENPKMFDAFRKIARTCSHPVGAWQAAKLADEKNAHEIAEFINEEANKAPGLKEKIIESSRKMFENKGITAAMLEPSEIRANPSQPEEKKLECSAVQGKSASGLSETASTMPTTIYESRFRSDAADLSIFVNTVEIFHKNYGFSSICSDAAANTPFFPADGERKSIGNEQRIDDPEKGYIETKSQKAGIGEKKKAEEIEEFREKNREMTGDLDAVQHRRLRDGRKEKPLWKVRKPELFQTEVMPGLQEEQIRIARSGCNFNKKLHTKVKGQKIRCKTEGTKADKSQKRKFETHPAGQEKTKRWKEKRILAPAAMEKKSSGASKSHGAFETSFLRGVSSLRFRFEERRRKILKRDKNKKLEKERKRRPGQKDEPKGGKNPIRAKNNKNKIEGQEKSGEKKVSTFQIKQTAERKKANASLPSKKIEKVASRGRKQYEVREKEKAKRHQRIVRMLLEEKGKRRKGKRSLYV